MHSSNWLFRSLKERGLVKTIKVAYDVAVDLGFDWQHRTETIRWVQVDSFETASENKANAVHYQPTRARPLVRLLRKLQLPKEGTFVDLGCGKGKVLMIASEFGFRRVLGVEFCAQLCHQARANAEQFRHRHPHCAPIEVVESDAATFQLRGNETVFFLYNPFTSIVLQQTLDNIALSVHCIPREVWLIYSTPLHCHTIEHDGRFGQCQAFEIGGTDFRVYSQFNPDAQRKAASRHSDDCR